MHHKQMLTNSCKWLPLGINKYTKENERHPSVIFSASE
jgi:hypothetical protein